MNNNLDNSMREIMFESLCFGDRLVLQTLNSTYEFTVTNSAKQQGFLTGGIFGKISVPAVLCQPFKLRTGAHLRFQIETSVDSIYLKTTAITYLEVLKKSEVTFENMCPTLELPRQTAGYIH